MQFAAQHCGREQRVVIKRRGAQVGVPGREAAFQFVRIGGHHTVAGQPAAAVLQTPLHQRPHFGRFDGIAARQRITRRTVGDHGCIAAVARAVPDVGSFGYDRTGNRPVVGIHVAGEIAERAERRAVAPVVAQEGEERVDVLGLVVGPDRGIETLAAGTVHQAALGVVDALRSADFRKGEHGVDHGIGGVQHQIALPFGHQRTAFGALRVGVQRQGFVPGPAAAEKGPESDLGPRSEHQRRVAADLGLQFVTALHALCRSCPDHRTRPGNLNVKRLLARILQDVFFAEGSLVDRREKDTRQRKRAFDRRPVALDGHRAVEHDPADLLLLKAILIDREHQGNVPRETPHQRTVRIVRDGAQHRPHDTAFEPETAVGADTVAQDGGNPQSAHFDMVPVRIALADIPHDGRAVGNHLPAGLRTGKDGRRQATEKRQEKAADADHGVGVFVFKISRIISNRNKNTIKNELRKKNDSGIFHGTPPAGGGKTLSPQFAAEFFSPLKTLVTNHIITHARCFADFSLFFSFFLYFCKSAITG